ncbi:uncharacterized protein LOC106649235 [Trichogramma pretiosum]|uniref:uncharacterized protein LOC106649235 n=1 Tax=Trichogramma pretiosum TaxID=7493 RepID=UPI0006C942F8|nr:uncharacterized protein LOC106649235 [Trichogramma pretiosum]
MTTLATSFVAIVAVLNGIILLGSISPVSAIRSLSFKRELGKDFLLFSPSAVKNSTVYYGVCDGDGKYEDKSRLDCVLYRVKGDFSGDTKEDKCDLTIQCEFRGILITELIKIDPLGRDRAIVRWVERVGWKKPFKHRFRLSIVDFSNCKVTTTSASQDLDRLMEGHIIDERSRSEVVKGIDNVNFKYDDPARFDYNWPMYQKGEDDFEIVSILYGDELVSNESSIDYVEVLTASIGADGVVAKVDTLLPRTFPPPTLLIYPLSKDQGYLYITTSESPEDLRCCNNMTVALIQPDGQRRNLTSIQNVFRVGYASVSLANGMIGICVPQNYTTTQCTQFRLDDQEIKWFPVGLYTENPYYISGNRRDIYNLPRGEGFLTKNARDIFKLTDPYLLKIGLDGKVKQLLYPEIYCKGDDWEPLKDNIEAAFNKIFEDDRGNYCLSTTCLLYDYESYKRQNPHYVNLQSTCFEPKDFDYGVKYEPIAKYENGYPRKGEELDDGLINYDLLIKYCKDCE